VTKLAYPLRNVRLPPRPWALDGLPSQYHCLRYLRAEICRMQTDVLREIFKPYCNIGKALGDMPIGALRSLAITGEQSYSVRGDCFQPTEQY